METNFLLTDQIWIRAREYSSRDHKHSHIAFFCCRSDDDLSCYTPVFSIEEAKQISNEIGKFVNHTNSKRSVTLIERGYVEVTISSHAIRTSSSGKRTIGILSVRGVEWEGLMPVFMGEEFAQKIKETLDKAIEMTEQE